MLSFSVYFLIYRTYAGCKDSLEYSSVGSPASPSRIGTACSRPHLAVGKRVKRVIATHIEGSPPFNMTVDAGNAVGNAIRQDKAYNL